MVELDGIFHYVHDELHREDGPAVEWNDGTNWWYLNGKTLSEEEHATAVAAL